VFGTVAEDFKILGCLAVHHHFFHFILKDHARDPLEGVFKPQLAVFDSRQVLVKGD